MLKVVIGYDRNEPIAFHVLAHSIMRRASKPVSITPLYLPQLEAAGIYRRDRHPNQTTDFTFSRFLAPWVTSNCGGRTIFMDCDMLCLGDVWELDRLSDDQVCKDVCVVKHNYEPNPDAKFLGQQQSVYPKKNWSSLMVFNGHRMAVRKLTPNYINTATPMELHQFKWCAGDDDIGSLPLEWNHLVGEYAPNPNAKLVHFTRGGPWFPQFQTCEYAEKWWDEFYDMTCPSDLRENVPFPAGLSAVE